MRGRLRDFAVRSASSAATGAVVAVIAYLAAYQSYRENYGLRRDEYATRALLDGVERAIEEHRESVGRPPGSLSELESIKGWMVDGRLLDSWQRPVQYAVEGDRFILYSFGRDGRPGGEGSDADVYPRSAGRPLGRPTLRQFAFDLPTEGIRTTCLAAGVIAALTCFRASSTPAPWGGREIVPRFAATAVGSILVAIWLSALHIPNGH